MGNARFIPNNNTAVLQEPIDIQMFLPGFNGSNFRLIGRPLERKIFGPALRKRSRIRKVAFGSPSIGKLTDVGVVQNNGPKKTIHEPRGSASAILDSHRHCLHLRVCKKASRQGIRFYRYGSGKQPSPFGIDDSLGVEQGGVSRIPRYYGLPNQNAEANKCPNDTIEGCLQVTPVEAVERRILSLLCFGFCLWLLYYVAGRCLIAGHYGRFAGACLLGAACFLLTIEFADAASAFGISGWSSIGRNFLCAYTEHYCEEGCRDKQSPHDSNTVPPSGIRSTAYVDAVDNAFGSNVDFPQVINAAI
jgi:hypothetical protein